MMMKKTLLTILLILNLLPSAAFAATAGPTTIPCVPSLPCIDKETQLSGATTRSFVTDTFGSSFMALFLGITAMAAVIGIIIGGMQMHFALGVEEEVTKAKKTIMWSIAGLLLAMFSVAIVKIVEKLF